MFFIFALVISCGGGGGGGSGGSSDGPFSGQSGDFFVATVESGDNTIEFNAVSVNTGIGFSTVVIVVLDNLTGNFFRINFNRPSEVPTEIFVNDVFFPEFQFQLGADFFFSTSGSILVTQLTNERVQADFDITAVNQLTGTQVRAIGVFSLPNGVIILQ